MKGAVQMPMLIPMRFARGITVVRDEAGDLTLVNSMRLGGVGLAELEALGPIKNVIRLAGAHGRDDAFYRQQYGAKIFAIEGQFYSRKMDQAAENYMEPDVWLSETSELPLSDASLRVIHSAAPPEALLLLRRPEGGVLVAGDSLQNLPAPDEFTNFPAKIVMKKMGFFVPYNVGPGWLKYARPMASEVRALLELDFEHVLPAHGDPVIGDAKEKYAAAIHGPLDGAR